MVEADIDPVDDTAVYTCGPKLFMVEMKQHSQTVGVEGKNSITKSLWSNNGGLKMADVVNNSLQWRWFIVAAIVGTAPNLINQWETMVGAAAIHYSKLMLTYIVPYLVSSISIWQAKKSIE